MVQTGLSVPRLSGMIRIPCRRSRWELVSLTVFHGIALVTAWAVRGHGGAWTWLGLVAILTSLGIGYWGSRLERVVRIDVDARGGLLVVYRDGGREIGRWQPHSGLFPGLVVLHWRNETGGRRPAILIGADVTSPVLFRRLKVLLRHPL